MDRTTLQPSASTLFPSEFMADDKTLAQSRVKRTDPRADKPVGSFKSFALGEGNEWLLGNIYTSAN